MLAAWKAFRLRGHDLPHKVSCSSILLESTYCGLMAFFQVPFVMLFDIPNIFTINLLHGRTRSKMDSLEAACRDVYFSYTSPREISLATSKEDMSLPQVSTLVNKNEFSEFVRHYQNRKVIGYRSTEPEHAAKAIKLRRISTLKMKLLKGEFVRGNIEDANRRTEHAKHHKRCLKLAADCIGN